MRLVLVPLLLVSVLLPAGCGAPVDVTMSAAGGRVCSVDKGERHCHPELKPPEPQAFCTRSLGVPDCWADPAALPNHPREIADGPRTLTPEQEADRTRWWPKLW
jgi:hypothetical protein